MDDTERLLELYRQREDVRRRMVELRSEGHDDRADQLEYTVAEITIEMAPIVERLTLRWGAVTMRELERHAVESSSLLPPYGV